MPKKKSHDRGEGQTSASVSISAELLQRVDDMANAEHRSRSNMICKVLREAVDEYDATGKKTKREDCPYAGRQPAPPRKKSSRRSA